MGNENKHKINPKFENLNPRNDANHVFVQNSLQTSHSRLGLVDRTIVSNKSDYMLTKV